jgi:NADH-quinone oxidoreductase subunit G
VSERPRPVEITDPVTITVDGRPVEVQRGELLIDACERNDAYIPRFCYHPRMEPVGMCRMCLVEVDTGRGPALQPSCMINVAPDMVVDTTSDLVAKAQDGVLEFLLANHPLDCPVCDKGGECPLQDQTMAYGPGESRWVEEKRHYEKPIEISPLVLLDRERCILCDRCTRFASEVTDDPLIHFVNRGSNTEVNTFPGEPFSSYFSGNTVQICPVGALTASPYRFRARPWDLERTESTCTTCSVGCRVTLESSRDRLVRINGVDADPVNWSWLCDAGRFGFEATNSEDRVTEPLRRDPGGSFEPLRWSAALAVAADALAAADPQRVAVLGGARLSDESAYAWAALAKGVIGTDHVDAQLGDGLPAAVLDLPGATIDEVCAPGGTVLYVGPDPKEELPVLFLRLKHAAERDGVRIIEVTPTATSLAPYAALGVHARPGELAAVARAITTGDVAADGVGGVDAGTLRSAAALVDEAQGPVRIVVGRANLAESGQVVLDAALEFAALAGATFLPVLRRANVRGALGAGLSPGRLPGSRRRRLVAGVGPRAGGRRAGCDRRPAGGRSWRGRRPGAARRRSGERCRRP